LDRNKEGVFLGLEGINLMTNVSRNFSSSIWVHIYPENHISMFTEQSISKRKWYQPKCVLTPETLQYTQTILKLILMKSLNFICTKYHWCISFSMQIWF
jgi:hypothetical protein